MQLEELLAKCFLFKKLDPQALHKVARTAQQVNVNGHDIIFEANAPGDCMYLIRYGSVVIDKDGEEIARLGQGSHFGEVALLDGRERSATVVAAEHAELIKLDRKRLEAVLASDPKLASDIYHAFCVYLCSQA